MELCVLGRIIDNSTHIFAVMMLPFAALTNASTNGVSINAGGGPTHTVNPLYMGCHSDSGFGHQVRSLYSNLLSGESFEPEPGATWGQTLLPPTADASVSLEGSGAGMHGQTALRVNYRTGSGLAGQANRGFRNEGLYVRKGLVYEGYLFVKSAAAAVIDVSLRAYTPGGNGTRPLSQAMLPFGGGNWSRLNFTLRPAEDALCEGIPLDSDPLIHCDHTSDVGHICVRCGAEFVVGLSSPGDVLIDFVVLQPGEWGRFASLPVHKHTVQTLQRMGVTAIRFGGSFVSYYGGYCARPLELEPAAGARMNLARTRPSRSRVCPTQPASGHRSVRRLLEVLARRAVGAPQRRCPLGAGRDEFVGPFRADRSVHGHGH